MEHRVHSQSVSVVVETRDAFARHGEEMVRARYAPELANRGFEWPATGVTLEDFRDKEVIVAQLVASSWDGRSWTPSSTHWRNWRTWRSLRPIVG